MNIFTKILNYDECKEKPPVLIDVGASGYLNPEWKKISNQSICIAFDADNRDFSYIEKLKSSFLKLHSINKIVSINQGQKNIYLTKAPYCSSTLPPSTDKVNAWSFGELFEVQQTIKIQTVTISQILEESSINYIDWIKLDSQGTDLRIFKSLGSEIILKVCIAEFEPGIMDSYQGEDKMHSLMSFMDKNPFWLSDLDIKGPQKLKTSTLNNYFNKVEKKLLSCYLKESAFWGEMTYINSFEQDKLNNIRDLFIGWIFCTIKKQHGFALELADKGLDSFKDDRFYLLKNYSIFNMKRNFIKIPFYIAFKLIRRTLKK